MAKQVESEFCRIEERALREFSDEERALLHDFLIRIKDNLEKKEDLRYYNQSVLFRARGGIYKARELGVSPISSVANVMSCKFVFLSLGTREGTIISALQTGVVVKSFSGKLKKTLDIVLKP